MHINFVAVDLDIVYIFLVCYTDFHLQYKRISKST